MTIHDRETVHRYAARVHWRGSTGSGYLGYSRDHDGSTGSGPAPGSAFSLSADPAFQGDPARTNPEELLVLAASSCQLLSFLARAARAGVTVVGYEDDASGLMPEPDDGTPPRIESILLRPVITVTAGTDLALVEELIEQAHQGCYIANSLVTDVVLHPRVTVS